MALPPFLLVLAVALDHGRRVLARSVLVAFSLVAVASLCNYYRRDLRVSRGNVALVLYDSTKAVD